MNVYRLTRVNCEFEWDSMLGIVVFAESVHAARELAASEAGDEGAEVWKLNTKSRIERVGTAVEGAETGVILKDIAWE